MSDEERTKAGAILAGGLGLIPFADACAAVVEEPAVTTEAGDPPEGAGAGRMADGGGGGRGPGISTDPETGGFTGEGGGCVDFDPGYDPVIPPIDVVMVVDTSDSMASSIDAIEANLHVNFDSMLQASGLDYRVFMIARHSAGDSAGDLLLCIPPPLSTTTDCSGPPGSNPGRFYHWDAPLDEVALDPELVLAAIRGGYDDGSLPPIANPPPLAIDPELVLAAIRGGYDDAPLPPISNPPPLVTFTPVLDTQGDYPGGLAPLMRQDSVKHWIWITDDNPADETEHGHFDNPRGLWGRGDTTDTSDTSVVAEEARRFTRELAAIDPVKFAPERQVHHGILGLVAPENGFPYGPLEPIELARCDLSAQGGTGAADGANSFVQFLTRLGGAAGGLRSSICNTADYDEFFLGATERMMDPYRISCRYPAPSPEDLRGGHVIEALLVVYEPGDGSADRRFYEVESESSCDEDGGYHIAGETITLCPSTCETVREDPHAQIRLYIDCPTVP
ncbi:MAG: hypothetical protein AAGA56_12395 [Myxococcota bacterium]